MVTLYNDLSVGKQHEQTLDRLLDLLKRDQLDEAVSLEPLVASLAHFVNVHTVHVVPALQAAPASIQANEMMASFVRTVLAGSEALTVDASCLAAFTGLVRAILRKPLFLRNLIVSKRA